LGSGKTGPGSKSTPHARPRGRRINTVLTKDLRSQQTSRGKVASVGQGRQRTPKANRNGDSDLEMSFPHLRSLGRYVGFLPPGSIPTLNRLHVSASAADSFSHVHRKRTRVVLLRRCPREPCPACGRTTFAIMRLIPSAPGSAISAAGRRMGLPLVLTTHGRHARQTSPSAKLGASAYHRCRLNGPDYSTTLLTDEDSRPLEKRLLGQSLALQPT
jgi:hypothetical protein